MRSVIAAERRSAQHRLDRTTPEGHLQPKAEVPGLTGPAIAMIARPVLALAGQTALALMMRARHPPDPFRRVAGYWIVTSSVADVGCLLMLRAFARRDGLTESRSTARAPDSRRLGIRFQGGGPGSCARIQR